MLTPALVPADCTRPASSKVADRLSAQLSPQAAAARHAQDRSHHGPPFGRCWLPALFAESNSTVSSTFRGAGRTNGTRRLQALYGPLKRLAYQFDLRARMSKSSSPL